MNFLYIATPRDMQYTTYLRGCIGPNHNVITKSSSTNYLTEITQAIELVKAKHNQPIHGIIVSDPQILARYLKTNYGTQVNVKNPATLHNYQGAMFSHEVKLSNGTSYKVPVVIITSPEHLVYDHAKRFLTATYISKLWDPTFFTAPRLVWSEATPDTIGTIYNRFNSPNCILCSIDIETKNFEVSPELTGDAEVEGVSVRGMTYIGQSRTASGTKGARLVNLLPGITMVGFTGVFLDAGKLSSYTVIIRMNSEDNYKWIKNFCELPAPKVFHNGKYDNEWLIRFGLPVHNWLFDTYGLMHSWYVELPRTLSATSALVLRNHMYWKDESESNLAEYCAKDCHATAWACLELVRKMPDWAKENYNITFKMVFPAMTCNLEGWRENPEKSKELWETYRARIKADQEWWDKAITPNFNTNSSVQVKLLFQNILGMGIKSTEKKTLESVAYKHPLWQMFVDRLFSTREAKKADATYMNIELFDGRVLYGLDPFGTDTSRFACRSSSFWCGTQIQNIPNYARSKFEFDDGWIGCSADGEQAESRTTAYLTGEERLIDAVENSRDFHTKNASLFFGIPEDELFALKSSDPERYKTYRNKIGKRVNHGANYNMQEKTLISTMGPRNIIAAKALLKLPAKWGFQDVAKFLLDCFDRAYPKIRSKLPGGYHYAIIEMVRKTSKLVTPNGWTRFTFLRPGPEPENKLDLNALVAHLPQGWSVQIINRALFNTWYKLQIQENKIRIKAQVHDEIIYQTLPEYEKETIEYVAAQISAPNKIGDRIMRIPTSPKGGARFWTDLKD